MRGHRKKKKKGNRIAYLSFGGRIFLIRFGGRITLVQLCLLLSFPSIFKPPIKVTSEIEHLQKDFLWSGFGRDQVCKPKRKEKGWWYP